MEDKVSCFMDITSARHIGETVDQILVTVYKILKKLGCYATIHINFRRNVVHNKSSFSVFLDNECS